MRNSVESETRFSRRVFGNKVIETGGLVVAMAGTSGIFGAIPDALYGRYEEKKATVINSASSEQYNAGNFIRGYQLMREADYAATDAKGGMDAANNLGIAGTLLATTGLIWNIRVNRLTRK